MSATPPQEDLSTALPAGSGLEERAAAIGGDLAGSLQALVQALPEGSQGPQRLAHRLGLDKVLASRLLKALRQGEPLAVLHHVPGPEPLRRLVKAARKQAEVPAALASAAEAAIARFEDLIHAEAGDRASLGAMLASWLPEARSEFELRRKQAAYRAMSELKGVSAEVCFSAVLVQVSPTHPERLDVVWVIGMRGLQRRRPGAVVRFLTRRMGADDVPRHPTDLEGRAIEALEKVRLELFHEGPPAPVEVQRAGEVVHYTLGETGFGPRSAVDLCFVEVNRAELPRSVPIGSERRAYFFHEVETPCRRLVFDAYLGEGVYPDTEAELFVHDACNRGPADVNDPARAIDLLDLGETVAPLGPGLTRARTADVPRYVELLEHLCGQLGWDPARLRGHRTRIAFPVYGTQISLAFRAPQV